MNQQHQHQPPNQDTVRQIFSVYREHLMRYGVSIHRDHNLVQDSLQNLFLKFCENPQLIIQANNQEAYMKSSLRREIIKKANDRQRKLDEAPTFREIAVPSYEDILIKRQNSLQDSIKMQNMLKKLSPSQKTILTLRFYKGLSYDDIASKLDIKTRTVYNQVHDAMKKLRNIYK